MGIFFLPLCWCLLCWVLHALLAIGVPAGEICVLWHFPEMLLPSTRWEPADHGDGGAVWTLCIIPGHSKCGVEDLHCGDGAGLRSSPFGRPYCTHGVLCVWVDLQDCGQGCWRHPVLGWWVIADFWPWTQLSSFTVAPLLFPIHLLNYLCRSYIKCSWVCIWNSDFQPFDLGTLMCCVTLVG